MQHFSESAGLSLVCQPEVNDSSPYNTCWSSAQKRGAGGAALFQHWQRVRRLEGLISCFGVRHREMFLVSSIHCASRCSPIPSLFRGCVCVCKCVCVIRPPYFCPVSYLEVWLAALTCAHITISNSPCRICQMFSKPISFWNKCFLKEAHQGCTHTYIYI